MIKDKVIYIVGEKIKQLLTFSNVITYNEFIQQINVLSNESFEFIVGQGLSQGEISSILLLINTFKNSGSKIEIGNSYLSAPVLSNVFTHKRDIKNTMVSIPDEIEKNVYMSYLCIDENCADMSDHLTGYHIQGVLLIEAARQMVTAVTEKFLKSKNKEYSFILNQVCVDFKHYVFYSEAQIFYKLIEIRHGLNGDFSAVAQVDIVQNNITVTSISIKHQLMDKIVMGNYELNSAKKCMGL